MLCPTTRWPLSRWHSPERDFHSGSSGAASPLGYGFHAAAASREPIYTVDFGPDPTLSGETTAGATGGNGAAGRRGNNLLQLSASRHELLRAVSRSAGHGWIGRAYFSIIGHPASLKVNSVRFEDAGLYTCTAEYRDGARRNSTVRLHVVAPPEPPVIRDGEGNELQGTIGPFNEGSTLALVCVVYGGKPKLTLVWSGMPDGMMAEVRPSSEAQLTTSTLLIHSLRSEDPRSTLYCTASNNISSPADTSVTQDLNLRPTLLKIRRTEIPISAGVLAEIGCEVWGSRPSPIVTWWKGLHELNHMFVYLSTDGNITTSVMSFKASRDDHGSSLACHAKNPTMAESVEEDTWTMNIQYKPKISLQLGTKLNLGNIQENNDVYLECRVDANPPVDEVSWQFNGNELQASENVLVSKNFLVIQRVQTHHSGLYSCSAENSEGRTQGETLELRVEHAPLCKANQHVVYAASRHQEVEVLCEVEADPSNVGFEWRFNSTLQQRPLKSFWVEGTRSVARYIPLSHTEYGTLLCTASNRIGKQRQPCLFHVASSRQVAGPPGPVENCSITNQTEGSLHLECQAGSDGHMPAHFILSVHDVLTVTVVANFTADKPDFWVHDLLPGVEYFLVISSVNERGRSPELTILPPIMPLVGKLTKSGSATKIYSNVLLIVVVVSVSLLCLLPLIVFAAVKLRRSDFFNKTVATSDGVLRNATRVTTISAETAEQMAIALVSLDPTCYTIVCHSRSAVTNYSKVRIFPQALRIFCQAPHKENMITLTWIPAHAGTVHPRLINLNEVTHSISRGLVNRDGATRGDKNTRDNLTTYYDLVKKFYFRSRAFPPPQLKLNRAETTTLRLLKQARIPHLPAFDSYSKTCTQPSTAGDVALTRLCFSTCCGIARTVQTHQCNNLFVKAP
ncbi:neural cell adhesion molecule 2-like [Rhipicephalus microplus]|uniref:neural cell adhesion molecule 2-like n=1 Tax=Rhipicephalus microplus TaxID=6941 RepID=UPI003F6C0734